jgi:hypothetical protein
MDQIVAVVIDESVRGDCLETNVDGDLCILHNHVAISSSLLLILHHMSDSHRLLHDDSFSPAAKAFTQEGRIVSKPFATSLPRTITSMSLSSLSLQHFTLVSSVEAVKMLVQVFFTRLFIACGGGGKTCRHWSLLVGAGRRV